MGQKGSVSSSAKQWPALKRSRSQFEGGGGGGVERLILLLIRQGGSRQLMVKGKYWLATLIYSLSINKQGL